MAFKVHILHIPKTGGISLHRALQTAGLEATRSHDPDQAPDDALVVALVRNPIDRAWSVYRYHCRQKWFDGSLREFLRRDFDPWWWGVRNVQARYMRPGVVYGLTDRLDETVRHVCTVAGVAPPVAYEWHGKDNGDDYTPREYAQLAAVVGADDMTLYGMIADG